VTSDETKQINYPAVPQQSPDTHSPQTELIHFAKACLPIVNPFHAIQRKENTTPTAERILSSNKHRNPQMAFQLNMASCSPWRVPLIDIHQKALTHTLNVVVWIEQATILNKQLWAGLMNNTDEVMAAIRLSKIISIVFLCLYSILRQRKNADNIKGRYHLELPEWVNIWGVNELGYKIMWNMMPKFAFHDLGFDWMTSGVAALTIARTHRWLSWPQNREPENTLTVLQDFYREWAKGLFWPSSF